MDYLGWELERQRAALWALLGGGPEDGPAREGEDPPPGEDTKSGARRSPASPETARRRAGGEAGRYAGEDGGRPDSPIEPGAAPGAGWDGPGAWLSERDRSAGALRDGEAGPWAPWAGAPVESAGAPGEGTIPREAALLPGTGQKEAAGRMAERAAPAGRASAGASAGERPPLETGAGGTERLSRRLPWGAGWEDAVLRAEEGARALSRAVQRDARRYDGAFDLR